MTVPELESAIPVLRVGDYEAARRFWTDVMGFELAEEGGDPARFGIFRKDRACVFVDGWHGPEPEPEPAPLWRAYFHTGDVDALAAVLRRRGADVEGPEDKVYGMREFVVTDPAGNQVCFGQDVT